MTEALDQIRAAGTLLWRPRESHVEVAVVHRMRHDDWSLPKGKLDAGETWAAGAVRETYEETGQPVLLGPPLPTQHYLVEGQPKVVQYWAARATQEQDNIDGDEVDAIEWLPPAQAQSRLSYQHDTDVVSAFTGITKVVAEQAESPLPDLDVLVVLRHARAVKRAAWTGPDKLRPLDARGEAESAALVPWLAAYGPSRVLSSDSARCFDTVTPYAASRSLTTEPESAFSEEGFVHHQRHALAQLRALLAVGGRVVLCTHRPVLPALLGSIVGRSQAARMLPLPPSGAVIIHHVRGHLLALERHGPEDLIPDPKA